ncbi:MAG TPA: TraR/DksA family transcriptional regulator [Actinobacteria bacterium]|nr:TraR/DksA family transcriptional regulator [Actinomycetota bacterium]
MHPTVDPTSVKAILEKERAKLVHQLEQLGADERGELIGDVDYGDAFADAGAATAERTEVLGLVETLKRSLDEVDAALERIAEGSYGICEQCGRPIGAARLEARPTARLCVECKARQ